jgi:hypothetical protein
VLCIYIFLFKFGYSCAFYCDCWNINFFCPLIFTKSEVCDYRSGAQRGYFGFLLMDLCEFSGFEFILGSFLSFISLVEKGWIPLH